NKWWIWIIIGIGAALAISVIFCLGCTLRRKNKTQVDGKLNQEKVLHEIGDNAVISDKASSIEIDGQEKS
ncbi:G-type lectin S-receptor-like serine/threonine-protein kinase, partial [Trifolium medium]|nr:G-type lectin S-receptor-like serine/threonine-protein kinase [Trifolium medium]